MNRREFLKVSGGAVAVAASGVALSNEGLKLDGAVKQDLPTPVQTSTAGYARLVSDYDINTDSIIHRLDIIEGKEQYSITFKDLTKMHEYGDMLKSKVKTKFYPAPILKDGYYGSQFKCSIVKI